jgi:uncharacterized protein YigA (DUF484 family)
MSTREARGIQAPQSEEETVAHYLQQNPEFFESHLPLLARLRLPHARGGSTISLVERQVEVLRERHANLEQKLADFVTVARANDAVAEKLHRFTRRLLRAQTRQSAVEQLEASLREDFDSFHSVLVLIGEQDSVVPQRFVRLVDREDVNLSPSSRCSPAASRVAGRRATRSVNSCSPPMRRISARWRWCRWGIMGHWACWPLAALTGTVSIRA